MRASVMLENSSNHEILAVETKEGMRRDLLLLHKTTETGSPFLVVAGYYLNEVGKFDESILAEIETVNEVDYAYLKDAIRNKTKKPSGKVPITFW